MFIFLGKLPYWPQWLVGVIVSLAVLSTGLGNGWTSPYLAQLTSPETSTNLKLTVAEASWVASFLNLGRFIGSIIGAIFQGMTGRKKSILLGAVPMASGWICIMLASGVYWMYAARFLIGTASGIIWSALSLFIGEIADPKIRGSLIFLNLNVAAIGAFLGNVIGPYLRLEHFSLVTLGITIIFVALFSLVPDSPYHHVFNGDTIKAEESLRWYTYPRGRTDLKAEIRQLQEFVGTTSNIGIAARIGEFRKPVHRKHLAVMLALSLFLYGAGNNTMSYYAEIIVRKSDIDFTPSTVVIFLSFFTVLASLTATIIVDKMNRRTLMIMSSVGATLALVALGYHFHALTSGYPTCNWLPVVSLLLYNVSMAWGLVPVPCALVSEIFPPIIKTAASMTFSATSAFLSFAAAKAFQPFLDLTGEKYVFWTFSLSCVSSAILVWSFVPETRGKSLRQIQNDLTGKRIVDKTEREPTKLNRSA